MRYKIGDKVTVKSEIPNPLANPYSYMIECMLDEFGGKQVTIAEVYHDCGYYIEEDGKYYVYGDDDFEEETRIHCSPERPQYIEVPVPGGKLRAEACDCGGSYPSIMLYFAPSGGGEEKTLCFAEVDVHDAPHLVRIGVYQEYGEEVEMDFYREGGVQEESENI